MNTMKRSTDTCWKPIFVETYDEVDDHTRTTNALSGETGFDPYERPSIQKSVCNRLNSRL